jgi:hypothetical protein
MVSNDLFSRINVRHTRNHLSRLETDSLTLKRSRLMKEGENFHRLDFGFGSPCGSIIEIQDEGKKSLVDRFAISAHGNFSELLSSISCFACKAATTDSRGPPKIISRVIQTRYPGPHANHDDKDFHFRCSLKYERTNWLSLCELLAELWILTVMMQLRIS